MADHKPQASSPIVQAPERPVAMATVPKDNEIFCPSMLQLAGLTLLPLAATASPWYLFPPKSEHSVWCAELEKPIFSIKSRNVAVAMETTLAMPLGYAFYSVLQSEQKFRLLPVFSFGVTMGATMAAAYNYDTVKNVDCWMRSSILLLSLAAVTTGLFFNVDKTAGILMAPFTAWLLYRATEMICIFNKN